MPLDTHEKHWWLLKNLCGLVLIAGMVARFVFGYAADLNAPILISQILVIASGSTSIWHYLLLKRRQKDLEHPDHLVSQVGLFRWVRHPMYLSDGVSFIGLALLAGYISLLPILVLSGWALYQQALAEDRYLAKLFTAEHQAWSESTKLIIPRLL